MKDPKGDLTPAELKKLSWSDRRPYEMACPNQEPCGKLEEHPHWDFEGAPRHQKGTCETCGAVRKLAQWGRYRWRCRECFPLTDPAALAAKRAERESRKADRREKKRVAYPVLGGPLDGEYATTADFWSESPWSNRDEGMYHHLENEYQEFNAASGRGPRIGGSPSMIFVHVSLLKPLKAPRNR